MEFIIQNLKINMNVFQACIDNPEVKIVNLGSSCIYPLNAENPISEDSFLTGKLEPTNSPYAIAKIAGIEIGRSLNLQYGNDVINLMPTNLYGPNDNFSEKDSHVIPGLIKRMHKAKVTNAESFNIWGTGGPLREFLFVDDLSKAVEFLIDKKVETDLLNVGSGNEITIKNLAEKIKKVIAYQGELIFDTSMPDGNPRKLIDSQKINNLGWEPSIDLDEGLKITYSWFLENN
jgi:GDP-L-fucose synthase